MFYVLAHTIKVACVVCCVEFCNLPYAFEVLMSNIAIPGFYVAVWRLRDTQTDSEVGYQLLSSDTQVSILDQIVTLSQSFLLRSVDSDIFSFTMFTVDIKRFHIQENSDRSSARRELNPHCLAAAGILQQISSFPPDFLTLPCCMSLALFCRVWSSQFSRSHVLTVLVLSALRTDSICVRLQFACWDHVKILCNWRHLRRGRFHNFRKRDGIS